MITLALFIACGPPCGPSVESINSLSMLESSCKIPDSPSKMWQCDHPLPTTPTLSSLRELHRKCDLNALGDIETFALSGGDPIRSALVFDWLRHKEEAAAATLAKLYLEPPPIPITLNIPHVEGLLPAELYGVQVFEEELVGNVKWGHYPYWHLENLSGEPLVAVDKDISLKSIRYLLASLASEEQALSIVVESSQLSTIKVYQPKKTDRKSSEESGDRPIQLGLADTQTLKELIEVMSLDLEAAYSLSMQYRPCLDAPEGMVCIPGGEGIETFYLDTIPTKEYSKCRRMGVCNGPEGNWLSSSQVCASAGKRLPSHYELDHAKPDWDVAVWTGTWVGGEPPLGPCGGMPYCKGHKDRFLSDGTPQKPHKRLKEKTVYCASSLPALTGNQGFERIEAPSILQENPEVAEFAASSIQHDDLGEKGVCGESVIVGWGEGLQNGGRSTTACRDPKSYITPNEPMRYLWAPYISDLGGGYAGVGSDQNYDFIAEARSEWVWLYDYDPNVNRLHHMLKPLILASSTPQDFAQLFHKNNQTKAMELIEEMYGDSAPVFIAFYRGYRSRFYRHYSRQLKGYRRSPEFGWLAIQSNYDYIRLLHKQNRIIPVAGDMLATKGLRSIGHTAKEMGVPLRIYYTSNAPTAWGGRLTKEYKENVAALPFDDRSLILATYNTGGFDQKGYWHHSVASALTIQSRIVQGSSAFYLVWDRLPTDHPDLTLCQVPTEVNSIDWIK